jgi:hypothetical protein
MSAPLQKANGPAATGIAPDRGPQSLSGKSNMDSNTTPRSKAASDELWDRAWERISAMESKLLQVKNLNEVLFMASGGLSTRDQVNAVAAQCDTMNILLKEVLDIRDELASIVLGRKSA